MSTNIDRAELDYASGMKYKDFAEKYAVSINTVKSWKTRYKWSRDKAKKVCVQNKKSASYCSREGIKQAMRSNMPRVHREHRKYKANDNTTIK